MIELAISKKSKKVVECDAHGCHATDLMERDGKVVNELDEWFFGTIKGKGLGIYFGELHLCPKHRKEFIGFISRFFHGEGGDE